MKENIKVAIRLKPLDAGQSENKDGRIQFAGKTELTYARFIERVNPNEANSNVRQFKYDYVASENVGQEAFFRGVGLDKHLDKLFQGFDTTVFAYGPTGSGKTYTMQGLVDYTAANVDRHTTQGVIPRCLEWIFRRIEALKQDHPHQEHKVK